MAVELIDSMGSDLSIVNAARVSFHKQTTREEWSVCQTCRTSYSPDYTGERAHSGDCPELEFEADYRLSVADRGLINYLARNRHGTPFEMVQLQFRVRVPIGVGREWMRHRIGSFNEESTRYVEMRPDFYVPAVEDIRTQIGKPGAYRFEPLGGPAAELARETMAAAYAEAFRTYQVLLVNGVAKELARNVLPLGMLTEFVWSVNLRSLFNFLSLRTSEHALLEIRREAQEVERLAESVAPAAMAAWRECGRVSL